MKTFKKVLATALALAMVVTAVPSVEAAATAKLSASKATLYAGQSKTLTVTTPSTWKGVKVTAKSSNKSAATVTTSAKKVTVKAVKKGTAKVTVRVTAKKAGKDVKKNLTATITVKTPAVRFKDADNKNISSIEAVVGTPITLKAASAPASSAIKFVSSDKSIATVGLTSGKLTPVKAGKVAILAKNSLGATYQLNVTVTGSNTVKGVEALNGAQLKVTFNTPVKSTVTMGTEIKVTAESGAAAVGTLTGALSDDGLSYVITNTTAFSGEYKVETTNGLKTDDGTAFEASENKITVKDTVRPTLVETSYGKTGTTMDLKFSEPVKYNAQPTVTGAANTGDVTLSTVDSTTLRLTCATASLNKDLTISISGIVDFAGNLATPNPITFTAKFDTTPVAQATVANIQRTGKSKLVITFSASLQTKPSVVIGTTTVNPSKVDIDGSDDTKVNVTLDGTLVDLKGTQYVTLNGWQAYKTAAPQSSVYVAGVDFNYTAIAKPVITGVKYVPADTTKGTAAYLLVSYDKAVKISQGTKVVTTGTGYTPSVSGTYVSSESDIASYTATISSNIGDTVSNSAETVTASKLTTNKLATDVAGTYTIELPAGLVVNTDGDANDKTKVEYVIPAAAASTTALDAPYDIDQTSPDKITLAFNQKLDVTSAQTLSNYVLENGAVTAAQVKTNGSTGATVELTVSVPTSGYYQLTIQGITGYNGEHSAMVAKAYTLQLKDTVAPTISSVQVTSQVAQPGVVKITFSEAVTAPTSVKALVISSGSKTYFLKATGTDANAVTFDVYADEAATTPYALTAEDIATGVVKAGDDVAQIKDATYNGLTNSLSVPSTGVKLY